MPRPSQCVRIQCEFFRWKLFQRDGVWYADGRGNRPSLGKPSLNTRDKQEAERRLGLLDRANPAFISLTDERADKRPAKAELRRLKGRRGRIIPIHPRVTALLQKLHRHRDGKLFHGSLGGRLKPDTVRNMFLREVIKPLQSQFNSPSHDGFEEGRLHSFRHYFISECFKQGANESEIKSWVGHRDSRVVELYRHHGAEESRHKLQRLDLVRDREVTDGPSPDSKSPVDHNQDRTPEQNENH